ncbi:MAG: glyoxalase [Verrucomicrobiaceae bacterium]|nr:glyoxalase [Verrucomicrobiaceae bacterium]
MATPNLFLLYVEDPLKSVEFYQELLERKPAAAFPSFASFKLDGGFSLGLWANHRVNPTPPTTGNRGEIAFTVADDEAVKALHRDWSKRGIVIKQEPYTDVFGLTFVALDPDGHRIRVCLKDK